MMQNYKGEFSIMGIIGIVITLLVLSALMPVITSVTSNTTGLDSNAASLLGLIPFFIIVAIIIGIIYQAIPYAKEYV